MVYKAFATFFFWQELDKITSINSTNENKIKSFLQKKNFLLKVNFKNVVKQKRCTRDILVGAEKFQPENIKIEGVAFISK